MNATLVAIVCSFLGQTPVCEEVIVANTLMAPELTFHSCMTGAQAPLAKWKEEHPRYRLDKYTIKGYKCVPGNDYTPKGTA